MSLSSEERGKLLMEIGRAQASFGKALGEEFSQDSPKWGNKINDKIKQINDKIKETGRELILDTMPGGRPTAVMNNSVVLPCYKTGESVRERIQDYFSIAILSAINDPYFKEVQMSFASNDKNKFDTLIISANSKSQNERLAALLGLDEYSFPKSGNGDICTFKNSDMIGKIEEIINRARENEGGGSNIARRINKLDFRFKNYIENDFTIHIPRNERGQHAEIAVLGVLEKLDLLNQALPPSGSKLPCIGCATELNSRKVSVPYATTAFMSQMPDPEKLKVLLQQGSTSFGKYAERKEGGRIVAARRQSMSPDPIRHQA